MQIWSTVCVLLFNFKLSFTRKDGDWLNLGAETPWLQSKSWKFTTKLIMVGIKAIDIIGSINNESTRIVELEM